MTTRMLRLWPFLAALLSLCLPALTSAAPVTGGIIYVSNSGNDANSGASVATAKKTIQAGANAVPTGGIVYVEPGTYTGAGNTVVSFGSADSQRNMIIESDSANGGSSANTIINLQGADQPAFSLGAGLTSAAGLFGLTIENSTDGGVSIAIGSPTIQNCVFLNNQAYVGGAIVIADSSAVIRECTFTGNQAVTNQGSTSIGGAIEIEIVNEVNSGSFTPAVTNCVFSQNSAPVDGAAIDVSGDPGTGATLAANITNCTFTQNTSTYADPADPGGAIGVYDAAITVTNNILYGDTVGSSASSGEITVVNLGDGFGSTVTASHDDIQQSSGTYPGTSNINQDPQFVNATAGDLHLKPGSPCLGKGTPTGAPATDLDGNPRPNPPSMGAYEVTPAPTYKITDLGTIAGGTISEAYAINNSGQVVGVSGSSADHAFLWQNGQMTDLGIPPGNTSSDANAINDAGQIVGTSNGVAFLWTKENNFQLLPQFGSSNESSGVGINNAGQIITTASTIYGNYTSLFQYNNGQLTHIEDRFLIGSAINDTGQVAASFVGVTSSEALRWDTSSGTEIGLGFLNGNDIDSNGVGINHQGQVVGSAYVSQTPNGYYIFHAFLWDQTAGMKDIGTLGGDNSFAVGINRTGQIIGTADDTTGNRPCFVYTGGVMYNLNTLLDPASGTNWVLLGATGINDDGQIVGYGTHNGQTRGFLLTPVAIAPALITSFTITPNQVDAPGPKVFADVAVTGNFKSVSITGSPQDFKGLPPTFVLTESSGHWTANLPTTFLKLAKVNPLTLIATGLRQDGTTTSMTATLRIGLEPTLSFSLAPDKSAVHTNETFTLKGFVTDQASIAASSTTVQITLPQGIDFVSGLGFDYNAANRTLTLTIPSLAANGGTYPISILLQPNASAPKQTPLVISAGASSADFQTATQNPSIVVEPGLIPVGVDVNATGGYGLLDGTAQVDTGKGTPPLYATLSPISSLSHIWLGIESVTASGGATVQPTTDLSAGSVLALTGLIAPDGPFPTYSAQFPSLDSSVSISVGLTSDAALMNIADIGITLVGGLLNWGPPDKTAEVKAFEDIKKVSSWAKAASEFSPPPTNTLQRLRATYRAFDDIVNVDDTVLEQLTVVLVEVYGKNITKADLRRVVKLLGRAEAIRDLLNILADELTLAIQTQGNDMVVTFTGSPLKSGGSIQNPIAPQKAAVTVRKN